MFRDYDLETSPLRRSRDRMYRVSCCRPMISIRSSIKGGYRNFGKSYPPGRLAHAKDRLRAVEGWTPGVGQLGSPGQEGANLTPGFRIDQVLPGCHQLNMFPGHQLHHRRICTHTCSFLVAACLHDLARVRAVCIFRLLCISISDKSVNDARAG
jgi:hypothetical protein